MLWSQEQRDMDESVAAVWLAQNKTEAHSVGGHKQMLHVISIDGDSHTKKKIHSDSHQ